MLALLSIAKDWESDQHSSSTLVGLMRLALVPQRMGIRPAWAALILVIRPYTHSRLLSFPLILHTNHTDSHNTHLWISEVPDVTHSHIIQTDEEGHKRLHSWRNCAKCLETHSQMRFHFIWQRWVIDKSWGELLFSKSLTEQSRFTTTFWSNCSNSKASVFIWHTWKHAKTLYH